jgi:hypothetical protein
MLSASWVSEHAFSLSVSVHSRLLVSQVHSASSTPPPDPTTPRCDWVNLLDKSGFSASLAYITGNIIGVIDHYWWVVIVFCVIGFVITQVVARQHKGRVTNVLIWAFILGILLSVIFKIAGGFVSSTC